MTETDYKKVICMLVNDGLITYKDVAERVGRIAVDPTDTKYQTETYEIARRLIVVFNEKLLANGKKACAINVTNLGALERLLRLDKRTEDEVREMIEWCQADEFWHSVILSTNKLRKHYDTMLAQKSRAPKKPEAQVTGVVYRAFDFEQMAKANEESVPMPAGFKKGLKGIRR